MRRLPIPLLGPDPDSPFPPVGEALRQPDGLLAAGGDLDPARLMNAYRHGIFPWYSAGGPILWWSPDPRVVIDTGTFRLATRFARNLRKSGWIVRADSAFDRVIDACATVPRGDQDGTWITREMMAAYNRMHSLGHCHSVEVFDGEELIGGIYGVAVGRMFFGESMFSARSGGSKVALAGLVRLLRRWSWPLIDAQVENPHLLSLGATRLGREFFMERVRSLAEMPGRPGSWRSEVPDWPASDLGKCLD